MNLLLKFKKIFNETNVEDISSFFAPGRVSLVGDHTDYNEGNVLSSAISLGTNMLVRVRNDNVINCYSVNKAKDGIVSTTLDNVVYNGEKLWVNYILGVIDQFNKRGNIINKGLDILIYSDLPLEKGLGSSSALEVVTSCMLREIFKFYEVTDSDIASICQKVEVEFLHNETKSVDPIISANGRKNSALLIKAATSEFTEVPLHLDGYKLVIVDSKTKLKLKDKVYNQRRSECKCGLDLLNSLLNASYSSLSKVPLVEFNKVKDNIKDEVLLKRIRHVITDNERSVEAVSALRSYDIKRFGSLINESSDSLINDYEVSNSKINTLIKLTRSQDGVLASKLISTSSLGTCVLAIVKEDSIKDFLYNTDKQYYKETKVKPDIYVVDTSDGVRNTSVDSNIKRLVKYGLYNEMIFREDQNYVFNKLCALLHKKSYKQTIIFHYPHDLESILNSLLQYAIDTNVIKDTQSDRDYLDTKLMDCILPLPSVINKTFAKFYAESPKRATNYFYKLNCDSNYIRTFRIKDDIKYRYKSKSYGYLDFTINLSKPEKDPKKIADKFKNKTPLSKYPLCPLCIENVGYPGRDDYQSRDNLRVIPLLMGFEKFYLQYSPDCYYNEHCIVFSEKHTDMVIDRKTFVNLVNFNDIFPHYFIGANAELPIVGGSILNHNHYKGGRNEFPIFKAESIYTANKYGIEFSILNWPMSVLRLKTKDREALIDYSTKVFENWERYSNPKLHIYSQTNSIRHNTVTPILHREDGYYVMDIALRNNRTSEAYPYGRFHVHPEKFNIKKENIGLSEVMGLAILPARLKDEIIEMTTYLLKNDESLPLSESLVKHSYFIDELRETIKDRDLKTYKDIISLVFEHVGFYFEKALEDCSVFKLKSDEGIEAFKSFVDQL